MGSQNEAWVILITADGLSVIKSSPGVKTDRLIRPLIKHTVKVLSSADSSDVSIQAREYKWNGERDIDGFRIFREV